MSTKKNNNIKNQTISSKDKGNKQIPFPWFRNEYSPKNKKSIDDININTQYKVIWICPICGGEYRYPINRRHPDINVCPFCNNLKVKAGFNDLATTHPELAAEFAPEETIKPNMIMKSYTELILWKCPDCKGVYSNYPVMREVGDHKWTCPYCNGSKVLKGFNDLTTIKPDIAKEWSPKNISKPEDYLSDSTYTVFWRCEKGHDYEYRICDKEVGNSQCPYCSDKKILVGFNDLVTLKPELAKEWSKKNTSKPEQYLTTSTYSALWTCQKGHNYKYPICDKKEGDSQCPYCSGKKLLTGFNDLKTKYPELLDEWLPFENAIIGINPNKILPTSTLLAWVQCNKCGYSYLTQIRRYIMNRRRKIHSCPNCTGKIKRKRSYHFLE